ncbi:MAG: bifunctional UDP-N-acetylglucosamine diphosphorylase/glucosamine-1-phosphate N-acetyltransferase GlmU [Acidobacteria bacterium]|uniref:Bifunctional protein GlmU n=1 Tax=Candidatus Polarisedimenticola svalbardensis TaxID=2886004 RepID=A0A8J7CLS2_9BACT|nr:bifunctional UDP-N-acetylglucosamine diphosphorylase/glucosamine-1-phosphate N-acetyltransferase GlmU [Candidatus Polarisedimenticola svalbardensis]
MAPPREPVSAIILAAGMGTRMKSRRIKLLHEVAGRPMVAHVMDCALALRPRQMITVVGHQADAVQAALVGVPTDFVLQKNQRGTGHAVIKAVEELKLRSRGQLLILNGDLPTLRPATLRSLLSRHRRSGAALTVLTARLPDAAGYGRIIRGEHGGIQGIVEDRDATSEQRRIREINVGIYCADPARLLPALAKIRPNNAQREYYLTDAVHRLIRMGEKVVAVCHNDSEEVLGVNSRTELAQATRTVYNRKNDALQQAGVTVLDPARTWVDPRAKIGKDTVLYPDVLLEGPVVLGEGCTVRSGSRIADSRLGSGVMVKDHSVITESQIGDDVQVGPFAHLRPGTRLDNSVKVGNFVEVKKSRLREGVKASHLSYLGDADIGENSNIGAGTITCNYDGVDKHQTILGKNVFIGSDSQLVAPVKLGDDAYVGAGSTITKDVPAGALAVGRGRQFNKEGWAKKKAGKKKSGPKGGASPSKK